MSIRRNWPSLAWLAGLLAFCGVAVSASGLAQGHQGGWNTAPCCAPNAGGFGYFPTQWRSWPTEGRLDQSLPQAIGRTPIPAPAPIRAAPEGRPSLPPELPSPPMPPAKPSASMEDRAEPKPAAASAGPAPAAPLPGPPPAAASVGKEKASPQPVPPPKTRQSAPAAKAKADADSQKARAPVPVGPGGAESPQTPPAPKPQPKATPKSAANEPPLSRLGEDRPEVRDWSRWASPASISVASQDAETRLDGVPSAAAFHAAVPAPADHAGRAEEPVRHAAHLAPAGGRAIPALEGFCPVELVRNERWVAGDARFAAEYRGRIYFLAGASQHQEFLANPERYVPSHSGLDPVTLVEGRPVPGQTEYCAVYDGRLYMFSSPDTLAEFRQNPRRYASQLPQAGR